MRPIQLLLSIFILLLIIGCSAGDQNPVDPVSDQVTPVITTQIIRDETSNRYTWGCWTVKVTEDGPEVIFQRNATMHFNTVRLLEVAPCSSCLTLTNFQFHPDNFITVDMTVRHPFPGHTKFNGFDVRGVFVSMADYTFPVSGRSVAWGPDLPRLVNYDGYTSLFNPVEFPEGSVPFPILGYIQGKYSAYDNLDSTLNPFIAYKKDVPRRMFIAGEARTRELEVYAETKPFEFGYIVDASWHPVEEPPTDPLNDFPPEANAVEPYRIDVVVDTSEFTSANGSQAPFTIDVYDHQGLDTIGDVIIECPSLFTGAVTVPFDSTDGTSNTYTGTITNDLGADLGSYPLLVRVTGTDTDPNIGVIDAWQIFDVVIGQQASSPPIAIATVDTTVQAPGVWIYFDDDGSYDPDGGDITLYEWDFNNDGIYDLTGPNVQYFWDDPGTYYVQFRVTDDELETDELDAPIEITIDNTLGNLTGVVKEGLNLTPLASTTAFTTSGGDQEDTTEGDGIYNLYSLPEGQVQVDFSCPGYIPVTAFFDIVGGETTVGDVVLMAPEGGPGHIDGRCLDATTAQGITDVHVTIREGINVITGPFVQETWSGMNGNYALNDLPTGTYTILGQIDGYNDAFVIGVVISDQTNTYDITLSPELQFGELRIVLTWDEHPRDLDSHLFTPFIESDCHWHIAYYNMGSQYSAPYASLDVDDVQSYGPETVTIHNQQHGNYKYFVHHYTAWSDDQGSLSSTSNAVVKVYNYQGLLQTFNVPVTGQGLYWEVFDYVPETGELIVIDQIVATKPLWNPRCDDSQFDNNPDIFP